MYREKMEALAAWAQWVEEIVGGGLASTMVLFPVWHPSLMAAARVEALTPR